MNCHSSSTSFAPPCALPMPSVDLRRWSLTAIVVLVIIVSANWIDRAAHTIPPYTF